MTVSAEMQQRRGLAAAWTAANPVLLDGEIGVEKDTRNIKIGDGVTAWNALAYAVQGGAYVPVSQPGIVPGKLVLPGEGYGATAQYVGDFMVRGWNLGKIGATSTITFWTTSWNWTTVQNALVGMANFGANTVRVIGSYVAYSQGPATYKSRLNQVLNQCKSLGLKVIYAFLNYNVDSLASTNDALYEAMISDLIVGSWAADPTIFAWEIGNEIPAGQVADMGTLATAISGYIKSVDATTKVCGGGNAGGSSADAIYYNSIVDFHDIHLYAALPSPQMFNDDPLTAVRSVTSKPILVGEFGADNNPAGPSGPMADQWQVEQFYVAARRWFQGDLMGGLVWNWQDDGDGTNFGMYDSGGNPRPSLAEVLRYPDRNLTVARDVSDHRYSPVVLDTFTRAASATTVGTPCIGAAPSFTQGTWGIKNQAGGGAYLATTDASADNFLMWDSHSGDAEVECEFTPNATFYNVGIILRFQDTSNFLFVQQKNGAVSIVTKIAGVFSSSLGGGTYKALNSAGNGQGRLRARVIQGQWSVYWGDKLLYWNGGFSSPAQTNTQHGIYIKGGSVNPGDAGSVFTRFSIKVPLRTF